MRSVKWIWGRWAGVWRCRAGLYLLSLLLVFFDFRGYSQKYPAYDAATTGASTGASGFGRYFGNPAVWLENRHLTIGQYIQYPFLLKELSVKGIGMHFPLGEGVLGTNYMTEGFNLFKKQYLSAGYSRYFGKKIALGICFNYCNLKLAENYGQLSCMAATAGIIVNLSSKLKAGSYVFFPMNHKELEKDCFQAFSLWGLEWEASKNLDVVAEIMKENQNKVVVRTGMYYNDHNYLLLQGGIEFFPCSYYAGAGFLFGNFNFVINSVYHPSLGFSPSVTLSYGKK